ncbi:hypothetical protein Nepgr_025382 [Nepenthes gracilis]|uniref:Uncharacterized protein n=1 Tax=Nepenthes gracilis TaxID=150966 RepID=A0AAD3T6S0_NEPGR|nr:hypothetical protein Nepgr_025382 [Nepenthes gracilis]
MPGWHFLGLRQSPVFVGMACWSICSKLLVCSLPSLNHTEIAFHPTGFQLADTDGMDDWQANNVGLVLRNGFGRLADLGQNGCLGINGQFGRTRWYEFLEWMPSLHGISSLHLFEDLADFIGLLSFLEWCFVSSPRFPLFQPSPLRFSAVLSVSLTLFPDPFGGSNAKTSSVVLLSRLASQAKNIHRPKEKAPASTAFAMEVAIKESKFRPANHEQDQAHHRTAPITLTFLIAGSEKTSDSQPFGVQIHHLKDYMRPKRKAYNRYLCSRGKRSKERHENTAVSGK